MTNSSPWKITMLLTGQPLFQWAIEKPWRTVSHSQRLSSPIESQPPMPSAPKPSPGSPQHANIKAMRHLDPQGISDPGLEKALPGNFLDELKVKKHGKDWE